MRAFSYVVTDIDGTLTDSQRILCLRAIEGLRRCEENGTPILLASGQIITSVSTLSTIFGLSGPVIAENGGVIRYDGKTEILGNREICVDALNYLSERMEVRELFTNQCRLSEVCIEESVDATKVRELLVDFPVDINKTGFAIHIMSEGTDKISAIDRLCEIMEMDRGEMIAIGDSENDIGMLRGCGSGVAVANADAGVKNVADYVCEGSHGEGVLEMLQHFQLIDGDLEETV